MVPAEMKCHGDLYDAHHSSIAKSTAPRRGKAACSGADGGEEQLGSELLLSIAVTFEAEVVHLRWVRSLEKEKVVTTRELCQEKRIAPRPHPKISGMLPLPSMMAHRITA